MQIVKWSDFFFFFKRRGYEGQKNALLDMGNSLLLQQCVCVMT